MAIYYFLKRHLKQIEEYGLLVAHKFVWHSFKWGGFTTEHLWASGMAFFFIRCNEISENCGSKKGDFLKTVDLPPAPNLTKVGSLQRKSSQTLLHRPLMLIPILGRTEQLIFIRWFMYLMVDVYRKMISVPWIPMVRNFTMIACKKAHPFPVVLWGSPHLTPPLTGVTHSLGTSLPCLLTRKSLLNGNGHWSTFHLSYHGKELTRYGKKFVTCQSRKKQSSNLGV